VLGCIAELYYAFTFTFRYAAWIVDVTYAFALEGNCYQQTLRHHFNGRL
jgi:hypothetical protein